ncbi:MAG TPA: DUF1080 domain-containing protein [Acidobacteriota bacterium]|nr:DUF1080 domain-containing protein [Acidobacteriota bacterium]
MKNLKRFLYLLTLIALVSTPLPLLASDSEAITPTEPIILFDAEHTDLSLLYTWLRDFHYEDPDHVFTVVDQIDGAPAIRVSGQHWGGLITKNNYKNYHLIVEFRWGLVTWEPRMNRTRDNGILLHCQGRDGNAAEDFNSPWMSSVEFQIIEGGTGDIILVRGYDENGQRIIPKATATVSQDRDGEWVWDPEGEPRDFEGGRINWWGRDPDWEDVLNFRGKQDAEKPVGQWNRLDAFVKDDTVTYLVNGVVVNKAYNIQPSEGKLLFQSEGAELYYRRIELRPLPE